MSSARRGSLPRDEYEPLGRDPEGGEDLVRVQELFADAARPYLSFPWSWLAWAFLLPAAALFTRPALATGGSGSVLLVWSVAILVGGLVEGIGIWRGRGRHGGSALASWVLRIQGNLSLVALALSAAVVVADRADLLPGIWLLLLGHSFYLVGGLAFPPFRPYGLSWQLAGIVALWPTWVDPLLVLAAVTLGGNLWMTWRVWAISRR